MADYEKIYKQNSVWRSIFSMAIPALITILVMVVYNMADMIFIGQLGITSMVAAISIVSPVFSLIMGLATMIGAGSSTLIANAIGAKDTKKAAQISSVGFYSALILGFILMPLLLLGKDPLLSFLGTTEEMWIYAGEYLTILAFGTPLMLFATASGNIIRSEGAVTRALIGNMAGTLTNIILDPVFILGLGWGVKGAAIATVIGNFVASCFYFYHVVRKSGFLSIRPYDAVPAAASIFPIIALGVPTAVSTLLSGFASTFSNQLLSGYGTGAIAAMAAAGKTNMLSGMIMIGITMGCQPLLAYNYGARNLSRERELLKDLMLLTAGLGIFFVAACFTFRRPIIGLFLQEESAAGLAISLVPYLMIGTPFLSVYQITTNFLQATKNAPLAILISVLRQGLILIPMLFICHALFGLTGIAISHIVSDILAAACASIALAHAWRKFVRACKETPDELKEDETAAT